ncbi:MAG: EipA family protein, partial [Alphaproteobacteria bacterium]|nr:EipA family protein [Alphaproteobacteria bacterium]
MTNPLYAILVALALAAAGPVSAAAAESTAAKDSAAAKEAPAAAEDDTFDKDEMLEKAQEFFGSTTKGVAEACQKVLEERGRPNGCVPGEEIRAAC